MNSPINSGLSEAEPTSPYLRRPLSSTEQVIAERYARLDRRQYEADKNELIEAVRDYCMQASGPVQSEESERAHNRAMALGRLLARLEANNGR